MALAAHYWTRKSMSTSHGYRRWETRLPKNKKRRFVLQIELKDKNNEAEGKKKMGEGMITLW
jgi:hypothetical protein